MFGVITNKHTFTGSEARPGAVPRRHQGDGHGQDPPGECAPRKGQVQDPEGDSQGQHQEAGGPVREHVETLSTALQHTSLQPNTFSPFNRY